MGVILKFGGTLFVHLVFYDFFRDQLKFRVRDRKLRFLILLLCAAALMLVNSFDSKLINLIFGLPVLAAPVLLIFKDDHRKEAFLLLIGGAVTLFSELVIELFFVKIPFWQLIREELHYTRKAEKYTMGTLSYILCWFVLHGLKICFLGTQYKMREQYAAWMWEY